jgi:type II secretory pathway component GspD/PulD (secretin)
VWSGCLDGGGVGVADVVDEDEALVEAEDADRLAPDDQEWDEPRAVNGQQMVTLKNKSVSEVVDEVQKTAVGRTSGIVLQCDPVTNKILIFGPAEKVDVVAALVEAFDR